MRADRLTKLSSCSFSLCWSCSFFFLSSRSLSTSACKWTPWSDDFVLLFMWTNLGPIQPQFGKTKQNNNNQETIEGSILTLWVPKICKLERKEKEKSWRLAEREPNICELERNKKEKTWRLAYRSKYLSAEEKENLKLLKAGWESAKYL